MSIRTVASNTRSAMPTMAPVNSGVLRRECACGTHTHGGTQCHACSEQRPSAPSRHVGDFPTQNAIPNIVHDVLRSPGKSLDQSTRAVMQAGFDHDFSGVRIHADAGAARSAEVMQARAYTVGRDVVFAHGAFAPHSHEGRRLRKP